MLTPLHRLREVDPRTRLYFVGAALLIFLGITLRSLGYFDGKNGLWNDEANWVLRTASGRAGGGIRPPGYTLLSRVFIAWGPSEALLRSTSYLAGVVAVPLFFWMSLRLGLGRCSSLLGLFVVAVHPWLISYAKEFKPYGLEFGFHVGILALSSIYMRRPTWASLLGLGATGVVSLLFGWSTVFLLPGVVAACLAIQIRDRLKPQVAVTGGVLGLGVVLFCILHFPRLVKLLTHGAGTNKFWGSKYDVFYVGKGGFVAKLEWVANKTLDLAQLPGELHAWSGQPGTVASISGTVFGWLALLGLIGLVFERRWILLLLWASPWLCAIAANWLGVWPYGTFRTNVFLLIYPLCLTLASLSWVEVQPAFSGSGARVVAGVALTVGLIFAPFDLPYFTYKDVATGAFSSSIGQSLETIAIREQATKGRVHLFLDGYACGTVRYYGSHHPNYKQILQPFLKKRVTTHCADNSESKLRRMIKAHGKRDLWLITARPAVAQSTTTFMSRHCRAIFAPHLPTPDTLFQCSPK